jgi:hypothetical protein
MSEANETFNFNGYGSSLTINVSAGDILNFNFTSNGGSDALSPVDNYTGTSLQGLGIFTKGNPQLDDFVSPLQVVLGYEDQFWINDDDDNHDDMLIRVDFLPVPVPATVWLFGSGLFGLVGVARRKKA